MVARNHMDNKINSDTANLQVLMHQVEQSVDNMLAKISKQEEEIHKLQAENTRICEHYEEVIKKVENKIEQYVAELERLKASYVNSNNNNK